MVCIAQEEARLAQKVVLNLAIDIQGNGHVISMDNFYTSVGLLRSWPL